MIQLKGSIIIRVKSGRNGDFSVGELNTDIGTFKVKDAILDQFQEGRYEGVFVISKIFSSSYTWAGGVMTEIRAKVDNIFLAQSEEAVPQQDHGSDPDPIDEVPPLPVPAPAPAPAAAPAETIAPGESDAGASTDSETELPMEDADTNLFGELASDVAKGFPVKLDPTIDRSQFRAQRDRLKALGYSFDATQQTWQIRTSA